MPNHPTAAVFYFDLASPLAYLAAERVLDVLPEPAEWQPVLMNDLVIDINGGSSLAGPGAAGPGAGGAGLAGSGAGGAGAAGTSADDNTHAGVDEDVRSAAAAIAADHIELPSEFGTDSLRAEVERRAAALGLPSPRWPQPFPFDSTLAMRVATYARSIGRGVPFAQAAFRQAYAGGRNLEEEDNVLIAAAACEMHPTAVLKAAQMRSTDGELRKQTVRAARAGVRTLPAVVVGTQAFAGEAALERAATHMRASARASARG
jgi:2-hydroxychromene-2-carboxylate isomerase